MSPFPTATLEEEADLALLSTFGPTSHTWLEALVGLQRATVYVYVPSRPTFDLAVTICIAPLHSRSSIGAASESHSCTAPSSIRICNHRLVCVYHIAMPPKGSKGSASRSRSSTPAPTSSSSSSPVSTLYNSYVENTPKRLKVVDAFLVFLMLSGIIQFLYCALITNFPFNSFIAG